MPSPATLETALAQFRSGDLAAAERSCQSLLRRSQNNATPWHLQGLIHHRRGRHPQALAAYEKAVALTPQDPELLLNLGNTLSALQRPDAALAQFERVLQLRPDHHAALNNKANALQDLARPAEALIEYDRSLALSPGNAQLHINRGTALRALGRQREAVACFEKALLFEPGQHTALSLLTSTLQALGDSRAESIALGSITTGSDSPSEQAQHAYLQGSVFMELGKNIEAASCFAEALSLDPDHSNARLDLALIDYSEGRMSLAEQGFEAVLKRDPDHIAALNNLANVQRDTGRIASAVAHLERAMAIPPFRIEPGSNRLMTLQYAPDPSAAELLQAARTWGLDAEKRAISELGGEPPRLFHPREPGAPLRVGYVSGDFWLHVVGLFLRDVIKAHDPAAVVPILYSNNSRSDALTQQLRRQVQAKGGDLIDISHLNDRTLRERIRNDRIDVLVDLSGHSAKSRVHAFALRPAPVQISWLGYFASTGLAAMDFVILDPWHAPAGTEAQYCERILHMPHNRFCYSVVPQAPEVAAPPSERQGHITFGSFNNTPKLNQEVLHTWARILARVPGSRLLLKNRGFADIAYCDKIRTLFVGYGITPDRLDLRGMSPHLRMLGEYGELDIALDPFPFSGGHTSCEALWMGVPVITLPQERVVSRQTYSFLANIGLEQQLSARDQDHYVELAVALAHDPQQLKQLRQSLRPRMAASPLCDPQQFTRDLETLYREAYRRIEREAEERQSGRSLEKKSETNAIRSQQSSPQNDHSAAWLQRVIHIPLPRHSVLKQVLYCVSATQRSEADFHQHSFLGRSLEAIPSRMRPGLFLLPDNKGGDCIGLSEFYNHAIKTLPASCHVCFIHDDAFIHDWDFAWQVARALGKFDVVGVAGSRGGSGSMPGWLIDLDANHKANKRTDLQLSGAINHLLPDLFKRSVYGPTPQPCEQIDGVLIATSNQLLQSSDLRFDPQFDFHCYDADFCRACHEHKLRIGTWPLQLTHGSKGSFDSNPAWRDAALRWIKKWERSDAQNHDAAAAKPFRKAPQKRRRS